MAQRTPHGAGRYCLLAALLALAACHLDQHDRADRLDSMALATRGARFERTRARPHPGEPRDPPIARWLLPDKLAEISGLALTADGRLLTHGDEAGRVFELDYRRGVVVKEFTVGNPAVRGDFEAIAVVRDSVLLLTSNGDLYAFREGANGNRMGYTRRDTRLGSLCEFEGLAFDPASNSLLLACKTVWAKNLRDSLVIVRWKVERGSAAPLSRLTVPLARAIGSNRWNGLHPSDITIDPLNGNYVLLASRENALVEITPTGRVLWARPLPGEHAQPEGVAITRDSILIVSDERSLGLSREHPHRRPQDAGAVITLYRWPLARTRSGAP